MKEVVKLACEEEDHIYTQAVRYLTSWLTMHPPVTPALKQVYFEALDMLGDNCFFRDVLQHFTECNASSKSEQKILLLEYIVTVLELDFNHCLESKEPKAVESALVVKAVWGQSHTVGYNKNVKDILDALKNSLGVSEAFSCRSHKSLLSLTAMVARCLNFAVGGRWSAMSPPCLSDNNILSLVYELTRILKDIPASIQVLSDLQPAWLRALVASKFLITYNDYLLTDSLSVGSLSLQTIVFQYFFLLPPLQGTSPSKVRQQLMSDKGPGSKSSSSAKGLLTAAKVNKRNFKGESQLHLTAIKKDADKMRQLLAVPGVDVNLKVGSYLWIEVLLECQQ